MSLSVRVGRSATLSAEEQGLVRQERKRRVGATWGVAAARVSILVAMIVLWETVGGAWFGELTVSSPTLVAGRAWEWIQNGYLLENLWVTLKEASLGFVAGVLCGLLVGVLFGSSTFVARILGPFVSAMYAVPKIVLAPLLVIWLGIGMELKVWLAFIFVVFVVVYTTWSGVLNVSSDLTNTLKVMGASRREVIRLVVLPAVFSWVLTGFRVSFPLALIGALLGELVAADSGLGYLVRTAGDTFDVTGVLVGVLTMTLAAILIDMLFSYVESQAKEYGLVGNL